MIKALATSLLLTAFCGAVLAQNSSPNKDFPDSVLIRVHPSYNKVNSIHRWLFGENYRREWAAEVKLPLIRISQVYGGLSPEQYGGGMETKSVRMKDKNGKEWVVRSVEKIPDKILPENLRGTFALDWVDDEYSGQHPYSALIVPPLAEAAGVPHTHPVIGVLVADPALGTFSTQFAGRVVLLEEREPTGESENTLKTMKDLVANHNNRVDGEEFLRARMLDLLVGDWDRHEDQWRWTSVKTDKDKIYTAVPRDRDQVFHVTEGLFPSIAQLPWLDPELDNFDGEIPHVKYSLYKTRFLQPYLNDQLNYADWKRIVDEFVKAETDAVLEEGIKQLPAATYAIRHDELLAKLKKRRDNIPAAMDEYYKFIYRIVDIRLSDKDELVTVADAPNQATHIVVNKLKESGKTGDVIMDMTYGPEITKEIRLYTSAGNDHVVINNKTSPIKLRIIDSTGYKTIDVQQAYNKVKLYGLKGKDSTTFTGDASRLRAHLSTDSTNARFLPTNAYNLWMPLATAAINEDDGFLLGLGFKYTGRDGFRKLPYSTMQELMITHSFETDAFRINYNGQWIQAIGKADITFHALADAPDNTVNFFGQGNETTIDRSSGYHKYYRTRFDFYQVDPALRWNTGKGSSISFGPSAQFYHFNPSDNVGRSIVQPGLIKSYDSTSYNKDKVHAGFIANFISNKRNNEILPSSGFYFNIKLEGYAGMNSYSRGYIQLKPEFTYYQKIDTGAIVVLSDRIGGGASLGNPAFYQSLFLGGQGNLLGYLQNRFAGQQMVFNNLQARIRLANIAGYILPGQLGVTGFYDVGRVWQKGENSNQFHQGIGGGLYFAPASLTVLQVLVGHSNEGWYPYISLNFRI